VGSPPNSRATRSHCTGRSSLPPRCVLKPFDRARLQYAFAPLHRLLYCAASFPSPHRRNDHPAPPCSARETGLACEGCGTCFSLTTSSVAAENSRRKSSTPETNYKTQESTPTPYLKQLHSFFRKGMPFSTVAAELLRRALSSALLYVCAPSASDAFACASFVKPLPPSHPIPQAPKLPRKKEKHTLQNSQEKVLVTPARSLGSSPFARGGLRAHLGRGEQSACAFASDRKSCCLPVVCQFASTGQILSG
jgi:hypothetical protein